MSGDVHPQIRKQSPAEANAEYDCALDWLQNIVGTVGRFRTYQARFSRVFQRVLENQAQSIPDDISPAEFVETRFEANALVNIWKQFQSDNSPLLTEKLRIIVRGADLTSSEGRKPSRETSSLNSKLRRFSKAGGYPSNLATQQILALNSMAYRFYANANAFRHPKHSAET